MQLKRIKKYIKSNNKMNKFREYVRDAEKLYEMAPNYHQKDTGLKEIIWVSSKKASHGPRIKVYKTLKGENFSVTIEDEPKVVAGKCFVNSKELKRIFEFIILNKDNLIKYWNFIIDSDELDENILKLKD